MDPIDKINELLHEQLERVENEILGGRLQSLEMYRALSMQRQWLTTMIADIKELVTKNDVRNTDDEEDDDGTTGTTVEPDEGDT